MGSIHRIGLAIAALATTGTIAAVFVIQGYVEARNAANQTPSAVTAAATTGPTSGSSPRTVYINPAPSPSVISVEQTAPPLAPPPVIHVVVPGAGGGDDDGGFGGGDH
jgi:hypothetical protein